MSPVGRRVVGAGMAIVMICAGPAFSNTARRTYGFALTEIEKGNYESAKEMLEECIRREPEPGTYYKSKSSVENYVPYLRLGQALLALGEVNAAAEAYRQAFERGTAAQLEPEALARLGSKIAARGIEVEGLPTGVPDGAGEAGAESPAARLAEIDPDSPLPAPEILADDLTIVTADGEFDLAWSEIEGASGYLVETSSSPRFLEPDFIRRRLRVFLPQAPIAPGAHLYVRVRAESSTGVAGDPSQIVHVMRLVQGLGEPVRFDERPRVVSPGEKFRESWDEVPGVDGYRVEMRTGDEVVETFNVAYAEVSLTAPRSSGSFQIVVSPYLGDQSGVESMTEWKIGHGLEGPELSFDPSRGELVWRPVPLAESYEVSYGARRDGPDPELYFMSFPATERCNVTDSGMLCRAPLRGQIQDGQYVFGVTAVQSDGIRSLKRVIEVEITNLSPAAREALATARQLIVEDGDGVQGLKVLAPFVEELDGRAQYHLLVAVGAFFAEGVRGEIPNVFGDSPSSVTAEHFRRARLLDPEIELPEFLKYTTDLVAAFDAAL